MLDRIERHDLLNALALSVVLLGCIVLALSWTGSLKEDLGGGLWEAEKIEAIELPEGEDAARIARVQGDHAPNEVTILVLNGTDVDGLAGRATRRLQDADYGTLTPATADELAEISAVFYVDGYRRDAEVVATILGVRADGVTPMPADVKRGLAEPDQTNIVVLLGETS